MTDKLLQEQIAYYRARATEYDEWFYKVGRYNQGEEWNAQWFAEVEEVIQFLQAFGSCENVLELACGTGIWTEQLLKIAQHIDALDASPEVLQLNRAKLGNSPQVDYQEVDLFAWQPTQTYDLVTFAFWLSHVPPEKLHEFMQKVWQSVKPGGQVFMVDSRPKLESTARDNSVENHQDYRLKRTLNDGRDFEIVKVFYEPAHLQQVFEQVGFEVDVLRTEHFFIYAQATKPA